MDLSKYCVDTSAKVLAKSMLKRFTPQQLVDLAVLNKGDKMSKELNEGLAHICYDVLQAFILQSGQDKITTIMM